MSDPVRTAIIAKIQAISGIGAVHSYQRYAARESDFRSLYSYNGQLRGWYVRRLAVKDKFGPGILVTEDTKWIIKGYLAVDDAAQSELVMDDLIEQIRATFRDYETHETTVNDPASFTTRTEAQSGAALEMSEPLLFCGVLCHGATLSLITRRRRLDQQ